MKRLLEFIFARVAMPAALLLCAAASTAQPVQLPQLAAPLEVPRYPLEARRYGIEGTSIIAVNVLESGAVGRIFVSRSSGFNLLDAEAMRIARTARFVPYRQGDVPKAAWVNLPVKFVLEGEPPATVFLGSTPAGLADLRERLKQAAQANQVVVHIRADEDAPYGQVARVIGAAQAAGVAGIRFLVAAPGP